MLQAATCWDGDVIKHPFADRWGTASYVVAWLDVGARALCRAEAGANLFKFNTTDLNISSTVFEHKHVDDVDLKKSRVITFASKTPSMRPYPMATTSLLSFLATLPTACPFFQSLSC
jgi:hypothetical protein